MDHKQVLQRSISSTNVQKTNYLKDMVKNDVVYRKDNDVSKKLHHLGNTSAHTTVLPPLEQLPGDFREFVCQYIIDIQMEEELVEAHVLNWCRTIHQLKPLTTIGDGNCLLHAISLALWGYNDSHMFLRRLLHVNMANFNQLFFSRWQREKMGLEREMPNSFQVKYNTVDWKREWEMVLESASDRQSSGHNQDELPYSSLEEIHVFAIANILRRPIIILAEPVIRDHIGGSMQINNFGGIYLPLLCDRLDCVKNPIILAYDQNHFTPLVSTEDLKINDGLARDKCHAIPLITCSQESLKVHFLLENEDNLIFTSRLLNDHLRTTEVPVSSPESITTIPAAKLKPVPVADEHNLMKDYFKDCSVRFRETIHAAPPRDRMTGEHHNALNLDLQVSPAIPSAPMQSLAHTSQNQLPLEHESDPLPAPIRRDISMIDKNCCTRDCVFFTSIDTFPYCHECYGKLSLVEKQKMDRGRNLNYNQPHKSDEKKYVSKAQPNYFSAGNISGGQGIGEIPMEDPFDEITCTHPSCRNPGCPRTRDMCAEHYLSSVASSSNQAGEEASRDPLDNILCSKEGCKNNGSSDTGYFCSEHFKDTKKTCKTSDCEFFGDAKHEGYCSQCYKKTQRQKHIVQSSVQPHIRSSQQACKNENCDMAGNPSTNGFCSACYMSYGARENIHKSLPSDSELSSIQILQQLPRKRREDIGKAKEYRPCKVKGCTRIGHEDAEGYCSDCYVKHYRETQRAKTAAANLNMTASISTGASPNNNSCSTPGCNDQRLLGNTGGLCYFCHEANSRGKTRAQYEEEQRRVEELLMELGTPQEEQRHQVQFNENPVMYDPPSSFYTSGEPELVYPEVQCATPHCVNSGSQANRGLCEACYKDFVERAARRGTPSEPLTVTPVENARSKCRSKNCDMFGDSEHDYLCSVCYRKQKRPALKMYKPTKTRSAPPSPMHQFYDDVHQHQQPARLCRKYSCERYGDPAYGGLCSVCFDMEAGYEIDDPTTEARMEYGYYPTDTPQQEPIYPIRHNSSSGRLASGSSYDNVMLNHEINSRKGKPCRTAGCRNWGNSRYYGYCNGCGPVHNRE